MWISNKATPISIPRPAHSICAVGTSSAARSHIEFIIGMASSANSRRNTSKPATKLFYVSTSTRLHQFVVLVDIRVMFPRQQVAR